MDQPEVKIQNLFPMTVDELLKELCEIHNKTTNINDKENLRRDIEIIQSQYCGSLGRQSKINGYGRIPKRLNLE